MKDTAPKSLGIIAVAALFGIVAWLVSLLVLDFSGFASFVIGLIVAIITAIVLWLGWREPAEGPTGPRDLSADAHPRNAGSAEGSSSGAGAGTAAAATAAVAATAATAASVSGSGDAGAATSTAAKSAPAKSTGAKSTGSKSTGAKSTGAKSSAAKSGGAKSTGAKSGGAKSTTAKSSAAKSSTAKSSGAKASTAKSAASKPARAPVAADGKPETLTKARAGGADDLKLIKGVGPGLEKTLNDLGFYHFDQVAAWRKREVQWVDDRLKFKGRIERDEWIKQAKILAKGGETEFSKRKKK